MYTSQFIQQHVRTTLDKRGIDISKVNFSVANYAPGSIYLKCLNPFTDSIKETIKEILHELD